MSRFLLGVMVTIFTFHAAAEGPRILYLSKSSGFQHSVVHQDGQKPSHTDLHLMKIADSIGATITCTKDASLINAENLKNYDIVIFYTTGDLTTPGDKDPGAVMGPNGQQELLDWIKAGGGFVGFHCASDTFHASPQCSEPNAYLSMVGGEFSGHGPQFEGTLKVVSPGHPLVANIPDGWKIMDEWYYFCNLNDKDMHVLALLDPGEMRQKDKRYSGPDYPIIWCRTLGEGRVYYNGMGHREDVWDNETFQKTVVDALHWANGKGLAMAEPNFDKVVPKEAPKD